MTFRRTLPYLGLIFFALGAFAIAAPTPAPAPTMDGQQFNQHLKDSLQKHVLPTPYVPTVPLHVVLVVETNNKGQVARVLRRS